MIASILVQVFIGFGILFAILGNVGVLFLPDVYTRLQASSTCTTTSVFSFLVAGMIDAGFSPVAGKILVITVFLVISSPISAHIIGRFAWRKGVVPWRSHRKGTRP